MDFLQLKYFQEVAKHQHLTKAAQALNVSQPALSKTIAKLETRLGYQLFDRTGRQIRLNTLGKAYLKTVDAIFLELQKSEKELAFLTEKQNRLISVAVTIPTILPELLGGFLKIHPQAQFRQYQAFAQRMQSQLESGEIDVGISTFPIHGENIEWYPIIEEEILLAVPLTHPLAARKSIELTEVRNDPFIVMPPGYGFRDLTENFCAQAGFYPDFAFEGDETGVTYELVEKGLGIAFSPSLIRSKRLATLQLAELKISEPKCTRSVGLVWHKERSQTDTVKEFIAYTIAFLEKQKQQALADQA
ncbi:DNA-binding transcriptional LysR family regulator [Planomicrobium koreense]|uniref:DNA-binding transcriptional LysR family regulator n=1 Tax=Planococcus koreensis TaxID=112331 RepID=A0A7W8CRR0_9BACL|nr:LysR family transcriptional regulator [Planococcus koreensis]MBB5180417.1 DNA-binding transcriptional LysR family regulator [Planococcus koreensis]